MTRPRSAGVPTYFCARSSVGSPPGLPTCSPLSPSHISSILCLSTSFTVSLAVVSPGDIGQSRLDEGRLISSPLDAWWLGKSCFFVCHSRTSWPKPGGTNTYTVTTSTSGMVIECSTDSTVDLHPLHSLPFHFLNQQILPYWPSGVSFMRWWQYGSNARSECKLLAA